MQWVSKWDLDRRELQWEENLHEGCRLSQLPLTGFRCHLTYQKRHISQGGRLERDQLVVSESHYKLPEKEGLGREEKRPRRA